MDSITGFFSTAFTLFVLSILGLAGFQAYQLYRKLGGAWTVSPSAPKAAGKSDITRSMELLELLRTASNDFIAELETIDMNKIFLGDAKSILKTSQQIAGKLNGVNSLLERRSVKASETTAAPSQPKGASPIAALFADNEDVIVMAAANLAGVYGDGAAEKFLAKAKQYDMSITDAKSFARLSPERRRQIAYKVKNHNLAVG